MYNFTINKLSKYLDQKQINDILTQQPEYLEVSKQKYNNMLQALKDGYYLLRLDKTEKQQGRQKKQFLNYIKNNDNIECYFIKLKY